MRQILIYSLILVLLAFLPTIWQESGYSVDGQTSATGYNNTTSTSEAVSDEAKDVSEDSEVQEEKDEELEQENQVNDNQNTASVATEDTQLEQTSSGQGTTKIYTCPQCGFTTGTSGECPKCKIPLKEL